MAEIYQQANLVMIWLSTGEGTGDVAMNTLARMPSVASWTVLDPKSWSAEESQRTDQVRVPGLDMDHSRGVT